MLHNNKTFDNSNLRDVQKTFNDGICEVLQAHERTITSSKGIYYYSNETVGVKAYFEANINSDVIELAIGIPLVDGISPQDIVLINTVYYKIVNIQRKDNKKPNFLKLFLKKDKIRYDH